MGGSIQAPIFYYHNCKIPIQMRGSPYLQALIWTYPQYLLMGTDKNTVIHRIYRQHVQAYLPNKDTEPYLHELVAMHQKHTHYRTCTKYRNIQCRSNFGQISQPVSDDLCEEVKTRLASY